MLDEKDNYEPKIGMPSVGIPSEVFLNPKLSNTEKLLFGLIRNLSKSSKGCWATNAYLAKWLWCSTQTVSNGIQTLKNYRYIVIKYIKEGNEDTRHIYESMQYPEIYRPLVVKAHELLNTRIMIEKIQEEIDNIISDILGAYKKIYRGPIKKFITEEDTRTITLTNVRDNRLSFPSEKDFLSVLKKSFPEVYTILDYWNLQNITKHKLIKKTKTIDQIIIDITKILKSYSLEEILESIKTYKYLIDLYNKKFKKGTLYYVGLNNFFYYKKSSLNFVEYIPTDLQKIKGLFEICVKGNDYAKVYFKPIIYAKDSKLAQIIESKFISLLGSNKVIGKENIIEKITNLFIRFYNTNLNYFIFTASEGRSKTTIVNWMFKFINSKQKFEVHYAAREPFFVDFGNWLIEEGSMKE